MFQVLHANVLESVPLIVRERQNLLSQQLECSTLCPAPKKYSMDIGQAIHVM